MTKSVSIQGGYRSYPGQVGIWLAVFVLGFGFMRAQAQDLEDGAAASTSRTQADPEPPPVPGAWQGSAVDVMLMEEGTETSSRRSPWSQRYFGLATSNLRGARNGDSQISSYNYISFDYRLDWERRISIRPEFFVSGAGRSYFRDRSGNLRTSDFESADLEVGDIYIQYMDRNLALIPTGIGDLGVVGAFRAYLPNSDTAKRQKTLTRVQARLAVNQPLGNGLWWQYRFRPMAYLQSQRAFESEFGSMRTTEAFRLQHGFEFSKMLSGGRWGLHQEVMLEHRWFHGSDENNLAAKTDTYFEYSTQVSIALRGVNLRGGITYERLVGLPGRSGNLYDEMDTEYIFQLSTRL